MKLRFAASISQLNEIHAVFRPVKPDECLGYLHRNPVGENEIETRVIHNVNRAKCRLKRHDFKANVLID